MRISDWSSDVCSSDLIVFDDVPGTITDHATRALLAGQHRLLCQFHASQAVAVATAETDQLPGHFTGWVIARIRRIGEHTGGTERQHALGLCRRQRVADVDEFADRKRTRLNSSH